MFWFLTWVVSVKPLIAKSFLHIFTFISSRINIHLGHLPLITIKSLIIFTFYYSQVDLYFHLLKVPLYFSLKNFAQFMNFLKIIHYLVEIYSIYFEVHHTMLSISHRGFTCLIITCWINSLNIYLSFFLIDLVIGPTKTLNKLFGVICIASYCLYHALFFLIFFCLKIHKHCCSSF